MRKIKVASSGVMNRRGEGKREWGWMEYAWVRKGVGADAVIDAKTRRGRRVPSGVHNAAERYGTS